MPLLLTGSQDQSLLALVVDEGRKAADEAKWYVGRTAIQKLGYFVQRCGVPCRYKLDLHHFGPYCADITKDVEWLGADGVVKDLSTRKRYSNYAPGDSLSELLEEHREFVDEVRPTVRAMVRALGTLASERLELLATLDFAYQWVRGAGAARPWKQAVIDRFVQVKGDEFTRADVESVYNAMVMSKVVEEWSARGRAPWAAAA